MTIAGKINSLVAAGMLLAGGLVLLFTGQARLQLERETLLQQAQARLAAAHQMPAAVYLGNTGHSGQLLRELLELSPANRYAILRSPAGDKLLMEPVDSPYEARAPDLQSLRSASLPLQTSQGWRDYNPHGRSPSLKQRLLDTERILDVTLPVVGTLNPLADNLGALDFARALSLEHEADSLHVFAYVQLGISETGLRQAVAMQLLPWALGGMALALTAIFISVRVTQRFTSPVARLAQVAQDIASGNFDPSMQLREAGEFREMGSIINTIVRGLNEHRARLDIDHQLLSMKVEERTAQLSRRNVELNRAVQQVTQTKDRLRKLAYFDSLTALPNRRLLIEQLDLLLRTAKRHQQILALLFLDLDNFKRINDSLGHSAGDQLLQEVARRLLSCVRDSDLVSHRSDAENRSRIDVSRLGGDEFTVVLNQIERAESAGVVAKRLLAALKEPIIVDGHEITVTPSIGIAIAPRDATDVTDLLKAADTAMYQAKARGKNNFLYYEADMQAAGLERLQLEADLRRAIERDELRLHFQPQVDCGNGDVVGAEALLRWEHPELGPVSPAKFIPMAEEVGLIGELGAWTLRRACEHMVQLDEDGWNLRKVAVNVSALQFNQRFIRHVREVLHTTRLKPSRLTLELTEGIAMDDTRDLIRGLRELKSIGVGLSIDDFGTGYSSLSYLSRFPLDELKVDRSFVTDCDKGEASAGLVSAIIAMADSMNLSLVAEGVESQEQYSFLVERGVQVIQGFLFSRPVPCRELAPMLAPGYFMPQLTDLSGRGLRALR